MLVHWSLLMTRSPCMVLWAGYLVRITCPSERPGEPRADCVSYLSIAATTRGHPEVISVPEMSTCLEVMSGFSSWLCRLPAF